MPYGKFPPPDIVEFLVAQHSQIRDLLAEVLAAEGEARREAFRRALHLLSVHEVAEEEVTHPVARRHAPDGEEMVADRLAEERHAKDLLKRLDGMDTDDEEFVPLFRELRTAVITHAVAEQRYEFNRIRQLVPAPERSAMRVFAQAAEATAPTHPHSGVESAKANLLLGPPVAIMDRARDAIRRLRQDGRSEDDG